MGKLRELGVPLVFGISGFLIMVLSPATLETRPAILSGVVVGVAIVWAGLEIGDRS